MKVICVFSIPRTGTNFLAATLCRRADLAVFGEIFHPQEAYGLGAEYVNALAKSAGQRFREAGDPALVSFIRANPIASINCIAEVAAKQGKRALYFKVFPFHWENVPRVISELASWKGFCPVILRRKTIDVYISNEKAAAVGRYRDVNTSDLLIRLDANKFAEWALIHRAWYQNITDHLKFNSCKPLYATYEDDINMSLSALLLHWKELLSLGEVPDFLPIPVIRRPVPFRQDTRITSEKVCNYQEFENQVKEMGLWSECDGYFEIV